MSGFTGPLRIEETDRVVNGRVVYRTIDPICFMLGTSEDIDVMLIVPNDHEFDGASVPRMLWPFFEPMGRHARAAALHDYLYSGGVSRWIADAVFREALVATGEKTWKSRLAWFAVRACGGSHYRMVNKLETPMDGKKVHIVAIATLIYAVAGWYTGLTDADTAIRTTLAALAASGFRDALRKLINKPTV